jgi:5-methylcytosine-specific restriction endonuclease McrA
MKNTHADPAKLDRVVAEARRNREEREKSYRAQALKMYPWVCTRCAREFTHANLQQLTVHHRDHNHDNNPPDGSNWELLCVYCHDNEHSRYIEATNNAASTSGSEKSTPGTFKPFADIGKLIKPADR